MSDDYISFYIDGTGDEDEEISTAEYLNSLSKSKAAEFLAREYGWYIVPCKRLTKNPGSLLGREWQSKSSANIDRIRSWWRKWPNAEIAVHCGKSDIVVFDVDHAEAVPEWLMEYFDSTAKHCTSADGSRAHYIFGMPDGTSIGNSRGKMPKNIGEVRGRNGVIVVGPSEHMKVDEGGHYWWKHIEEIVELPRRLVDLLGAREGAGEEESGNVLSESEFAAFLNDMRGDENEKLLLKILEGYKKEVFEDGAGRHDSMGKYLVWAFREACAGMYDARDAYNDLKELWNASFDVKKLSDAGMKASRKPETGEYESIARWAAGEACKDDSAKRRAEIRGRIESDRIGADGLKKASSYETTDHGNAEHMFDLYNGQIYWGDNGMWYVWNEQEKTWSIRKSILKYSIRVSQRLKAEAHAMRKKMLTQESKEAKEAKGEDSDPGAVLMKRANQAAGTRTQENFLSQFKEMVEISFGFFDSNRYYMACRNGLIVFDSDGNQEGKTAIEFRDVERDDYVTMRAACDYIPWDELKKKNDIGFLKWNEFLEKFLPGNDKQWLQKFMGYMLIGSNPERRILFIQGVGGTGKTTFLDVIAHALGDYGAKFNSSLFKEKMEEGPQPELANALNSRMIWNSELSSRTNVHADQLKRITGNEPILATMKYANSSVEKTPEFVPIVATNGFPTIKNEDLATRERIWVYPFDKSVLGKDDNDVHEHDRLLRYSLDAAFSWCIEGWKMYVAEGLSDVPTCVIKRTLECYSQLSDFQLWLQECCVQGAEYRTTPNSLWQSYTQWCEENYTINHDRLRKRQFEIKLNDNGFKSRPVTLNSGDEHKTRVRLRIGLKSEYNFKNIVY